MPKNNRLAHGIRAILAILICSAPSYAAGAHPRYARLDDELNRRALQDPPSETTSVILRVKSALPAEFKKYARPGRLALVNGFVLDVPNSQLKAIASNAGTVYAIHNAKVHAFNFRTGIQSGAFFARHNLGINGAGVGVAVLDSGVAADNEVPIAYFQDFLVPDPAHPAANPHCTTPCDTNGHGTHIAGTIAGNGSDSFGQQSGMAPGSSLHALRVLGADGTGTLDGVLNALDWVLNNAAARNIKVVNLSFGMRPPGVRPDADPLGTMLSSDPLAIATRKLVDAGIFVVAAAGNVGQLDCADVKHPKRDRKTGKCDVWGGITAPGTYPWVFTAGANSSNGTFIREDDRRATFSSRGPAFPLFNAKPDLLAGGVGIESTSVRNSTLYQQALTLQPLPLVAGSSTSEPFPYLVLSGTSQAAAVVSGVAAQMLQANPSLTPNLIKAILEYTSEQSKRYSPLEQGAGFLNALGAVQLSRFYATAKKGQHVPVSSIWSQHFIWGNHDMSGGLMLPAANAWRNGVMWGSATATADGDNIVWGTSCGSEDCGNNIVWGTSDGDNIVWGTDDGDNIVWGTAADGDNIVWGTAADGDNIVWGTDCGGADCDNIVWGTAADGDNIVWGTADDGDNIVWGTAADGDNIVWGTADDGDNIVWGTGADGDNIVWGTGADGDNIVWGTAGDGDNIVWGTDGDNIVWGTARLGRPSTPSDWYQLFLNAQYDAFWMAREFGDLSISDGNHRGKKLAKPTPARGSENSRKRK